MKRGEMTPEQRVQNNRKKKERIKRQRARFREEIEKRDRVIDRQRARIKELEAVVEQGQARLEALLQAQ